MALAGSLGLLQQAQGAPRETHRPVPGGSAASTGAATMLSAASFEALYKVVSGQRPPAADLQQRYVSAWQTDPLFSCAHPLIARHFAQAGPAAPAASACPPGLPFSVREREGGRRLRWLDPARISGIHLLFSGRGAGWASRFGHVSLRLVVCPSAASTPAACDENLQAHLVLGYLATVDGVAIDPLRGMFGGYAAHLQALPLMDVYRETAIDEFRDLYALPLRLAPDRLAQIVRELSEIHWQFADDYRFLNNNCATMLQAAMRVVMPELFKGESAPGFSWRPDTFFEAMRQPHTAVTEVLADLEQAERQGYFFASTRAIFERAAQLVTAAIPWPEGPDLDGYLAAPAQRRQAAWQADPRLPERLRQEHRLREAQLMLEELAAVRVAQRMLAHAAEYLARPGLQAALEARRPHVDPVQFGLMTRCVLEPMVRVRATPARHEGIPVAEALVPAPVQSDWMDPSCADAQVGATLAGLLGAAYPEGHDAWQAVLRDASQLAAVVKNVAWIRAQATGGP